MEQLKIGDNDTLSAQVATLVHADWLFLLTDVDALYTANPNVDANAKPIRVVEDVQALNVTTETGEGDPGWGTGGMGTKLSAAGMATAGGTKMMICSADPELVCRIVLDNEKGVGTLFLPADEPVYGQDRWILSNPVRGQVQLNEEGVEALLDEGTIHADAIDEVHGSFMPGQAITFVDEGGREIGKTLAGKSHADLQNLMDGIGEEAEKELEELVIAEPADICLMPGVGGHSDHSSASDFGAQ